MALGEISELAELARVVQAVGRADAALVLETRDRFLIDLAEVWAQDGFVTGLRESTLRDYLLSLEILGRFGIRRVSDVTPLAVRAFMRAIVGAARSPETANRKLAALSSLFSWLHAEGRVPLAQVLELRELYFERPFVPPPAFMRPPEYVEVRMAARAIEARRFELLVGFGVESGLRWHEARQLHREDLILEVAEPFVRVSHTLGRRNKTSRERTVPIRVAFAQELLALELEEGPIFPARRREGEDLLSPYVHHGTFRIWRKAALERGPWWDWNLLRHTFASWHVQRGRTITEVADWLGCGEDVARRHYAALAPGGNKIVELTFERVPSFARVPA
jgi:integrase